MCVAGWFDGNRQTTAISKAAVFEHDHFPVISRVALADGMPFQTHAPATAHTMALRIMPPGAEKWRTGINNIPVFPVNFAQGFYDQPIAPIPNSTTGKPDPARMKAFLVNHPEAEKAVAIIMKRRIFSGFANSTLNSLDAFRFVVATGASLPVRWSATPAALRQRKGIADRF